MHNECIAQSPDSCSGLLSTANTDRKCKTIHLRVGPVFEIPSLYQPVRIVFPERERLRQLHGLCNMGIRGNAPK